MTLQWLVRSANISDAVVPARDEKHAAELVAKFRGITASHRARAAWEYGVHDPDVPNSYRRVSR